MKISDCVLVLHSLLILSGSLMCFAGFPLFPAAATYIRSHHGGIYTELFKTNFHLAKKASCNSIG